MSKRMLIDATHAEETRVVVMDGNRLVDFDVETSTKKQNKGNIYLAKVIRVEPSLQAAFVEYGGNRHGFLAFSEIHPDYYQIPVADRERLLEMQAEELRLEREREEREFEAFGEAALTATPTDAFRPTHTVVHSHDPARAEQPDVDIEIGRWLHPVEPPRAQPLEIAAESVQTADTAETEADATVETEAAASLEPADPQAVADDDTAGNDTDHGDTDENDQRVGATEITLGTRVESVIQENTALPETMGGDAYDARSERRIPPRYLRNYKIQEVIHRRQILLIQVVKEERGTKGAALTTYISLAGRYCVLMPNSPRGGGISRKITSAGDRKRLREVMDELTLPPSMGMIVRTAGAGRPKPEIKRDCEYLLRLWDSIRETTLTSTAPALIYEEASLIKRAIRDVYDRDVEDITVEGEHGYRSAKDYMRMLMPSHARKVQLHRDSGLPLFAKSGVENQLDAMHSPTVQLKSGGYLVINQTEALVAIDVNSGRSTRERGIEETALRTNMEAAEEAARQLRLRDLAGLIVIDFIDMESRKHNAQVERKLKDALKHDRARIQLGHISHFGLLEMSRQRLRPSLSESNFVQCPHCQGTGTIRSVESSAVHVLRAIEEEGGKRRASEIQVRVAGEIAFYILNHKRERLAGIEARFGMKVVFLADETLRAPGLKIDRLKTMTEEQAAALAQHITPETAATPEEEDDIPPEAEEPSTATDENIQTDTAEDGDRRRRRRRRGRRDDAADETPGTAVDAGANGDTAAAEPSDAAETTDGETDPAAQPSGNGEDDSRRRRRGRRGGRRRRRDGDTGTVAGADPVLSDDEDVLTAPQKQITAYSGPTPADPFGGQVDIFDVMDAAERAAEIPAASVVQTIPIATSAPAVAAAADAGAPPTTENGTGTESAPVDAEPAKPSRIARIAAKISARRSRSGKTAAEPAAESTVEPVGETVADTSGESIMPTEPPLAPVENPMPAAPTIAPSVQPKVIEASPDTTAAKRRGWWKA